MFKDVIFLLLAKSYRQEAGISSFLLLIPIMNTTSQVTGSKLDLKSCYSSVYKHIYRKSSLAGSFSGSWTCYCIVGL